ncbi:MAG: hypothetical protein AAED33_06300 [Paracoccaceae bacterium]|jgi:hypothetical protein
MNSNRQSGIPKQANANLPFLSPKANTQPFDRVDGLGMDLYSDGTVVNWNGLLVGMITATEGDSVTIKWTKGATSGTTETFVGHPSTCRQDGTLKDC